MEHLLIGAIVDDFAHADLMSELTLGLNAGTASATVQGSKISSPFDL
ncbi:MAG: hypothetical protein ACTHNN_10565 [Xanthobacteraceae bacterium]